MESIKKRNGRTLYYVITIIAVALVVIGMFTLDLNAQWVYSDFFEYLTFAVPFCLSAWLLLIGLIFIKKSNWVIKLICAILAIPHVILIAVLVGYGHSFLEILQWYAMIFSFGLIH